MLAILDSLFINVCMVVALGYLLSLTYQDWRLEKRPSVLLLRSFFASVGSIVLLYHGIETQQEHLIDLRMVPLLLITLRYGVGYGLLSTAPFILFQWMFMPELPLLPSVTGAGLCLMTMALLRLPYQNRVVPTRIYMRAPLLVFLVGGVGLAVATLDEGNLFWSVFPWYYAANLLGFWGAASIVHSRLRYLKATEHLKAESALDPLTGLLNRRQFEADRLLFAPGDAFLVLDLDQFKSVNDTFGHAMGDEVLKQTAALLKSSTRGYDRVYRLGGEEFLVVLRRIETQKSSTIAERIRQTIEEHIFPISRKVTTSGGLTILPACQLLQETLERADQLLYQAKRQGRNQIQSDLSQNLILKADLPETEPADLPTN
ncbi:GGDEF domain-containing protein [Deinococcus misasensis]|uniref:GGDEF domain-containing protein n=1 Tax=Deinococcus misasensis TaxID=392413 RepID=UPI00068FC0EF|nr:GGDEF domain-containing protein [Deinococcus misasensis]